MQLTVSGKGNAARHGGVNGDLLVLIEEEPDKELVRDGNDLIYNLNITFPQAVLGASVEVPTVDARAKIKIEPGTQAGASEKGLLEQLAQTEHFKQAGQSRDMNIFDRMRSFFR